MYRKTRATRLIAALIALSMLLIGPTPGFAAQEPGPDTQSSTEHRARVLGIRELRLLQEEREAAAARRDLQIKMVEARKKTAGIAGASIAASMPGPGGQPDYFGTTANWAWSPELRKFMDDLPLVGPSNANGLGQFLSVGHPDTTTYPGSDYYEIELRQYSQRMHSDMPSTTLRGYVQTNMGTDGDGNNTIDPDPIQFGGPIIIARKDRPVRVKFTNALPTGEAGDLFLPVDKTVMGAGLGPLESNVPSGTDPYYKENRATVHLHGGRTVWISDGTPHQWITPKDENTPYPKGVSVRNVPDMPDPGEGSMTFFYSNQQSSRMMFYHDHTQGITRLNVYAGEAAGYFIQDEAEDELTASGVLPADEIPLIIQDKTYVDASTIASTDPTWNWGTSPKVDGVRAPNTGDLWFPHVYMPAQNPADPSGMNANGRWHYGPWFWPPTKNIQFPPIPNPYYDPVNAPWEPPLMPAMPNPSTTGEAWFDTAVVNGTAFPTLDVDPKAYRLRMLNAANDRFFNLQLYVADPSRTTTWAGETEVKMVPASVTQTYFPEGWPTDGRTEGAPDPRLAGPDFIQIGTEGGFLPKPAIIPQQPITWLMDPAAFAFGTVDKHTVLLGPAERADTVVDFSQFAGKTLILYNDAPAPFPAPDPRLDYYTDSEDLTDVGGYWGTKAGYGPNTRTIMQIKVATTTTPDPPAYDLAALEAAFASSDTTAGVFAKSQHPILVPDERYDSTYNASFTPDPFVRIYQNDMTFKTIADTTVTVPLEPKAIQDEMGEAFDTQYGRMSGKLGLEMPFTNAGNANFMLYSFFDPPTEFVKDTMTPLSPVMGDGTQIWKITQNGVDTHPMHFHLFEVQLINRVGWDNMIFPPDDNELGWKDTVRINPLMDTIVALRPISPKSPFGVPDSVRPLDPTMPLGSDPGFSNLDPQTGQRFDTPITNQMYNFGWEYVWHCHILSHEEMDMMRPIKFEVETVKAIAPSLTATGFPDAPITLNWTDGTPGDVPATWGNAANEIGFRVERATVAANGSVGPYTVIAQPLANSTSYVDTTTALGVTYRYRVVAYNAQGDTLSNVVTIAPPAASPSNLVGTLQDGPRVRLQFIDNSANETGFVIQRATNGGAYSNLTTMAPQAGTGTRTYNDAAVIAGDTYSYRVKAITDQGSSGWTNVVTVNVRFLARISGADRYVVSITMAKNAFGAAFPGVTDLVVASGEDAAQADMLSASGLAGTFNAPMLIVQPTSLRTDIRNTIAAMPAGVKVHIVGGTASVSTAVQTAIDNLPNTGTVDRIAGADRYLTAAAVASRMKTELGSAMPTTTVLVNGNLSASVFDALTASPISWKNRFPVLLVTNTGVPAATSNALTNLGLTNRYIIGGTVAVPESVRTSLGIPTGNRIAGADRYSTAAAAASRAQAEGWLTNSYFGFASATPDAATGGAFMGKRGGSLLYVTSASVPSGTSNFLNANKAGVIGGHVLGGTTAVPESVRLQLLGFMQ